MALNAPPPYEDITGISRVVMKDNAQETLASYNGNARPGEIVVNLEVDPPTLFVGNNAGFLTQIGTGNGGGGGDYSNANVIALGETGWAGNIIPVGNIVYNLGDSSNYWNIIRANTGSFASNIRTPELTATSNIRTPELDTTQIFAANINAANIASTSLFALSARVGNIFSQDNVVANIVTANTITAPFNLDITTNGGGTWQFSGNILREPSGGTLESSGLTTYLNSAPNGYVNIASYSEGNLTTDINVDHNFIELFIRNGVNVGWRFNSNGTTDFPYYTFPNYDGANGQVLITNGGGEIQWGNVGIAGLTTYGGNILVDAVIGNTANNLGYLQWVGNSSGDNNGYTTLHLVPDDTLASNDQYLIIDPTAPSHIHIRAGGTQDASAAELYLGGETNYVRVVDGSGVRLQNQTRNDTEYNYSDPGTFTTGSWYESSGTFFVQYTTSDAELIDVTFQFNDDNENTLLVYYNGGATTAELTSAGSVSNLGGGVYRVSVNEAPPASPTAITAFDYTIWNTRTNSVQLQSNDFTVSVTDDIRITGRDGFSLRNESPNEPIEIITDYDGAERTWEFGATGTLTTPGDIVVAGDISGTSGASTLVLKAEPNSNTAIQLNDSVDSEIRTVANLEIRTNRSNTDQIWRFDTNGVLTLPGEGILQSIDDTVTLRSINTGTGDANGVYLGTSGGMGFFDQSVGGNWLEIFRNNTDPQIGTTGNLLITTDNSNTAPTWTFDAAGNLTAPGDISTAGSVNVAGNVNLTGAEATDTARIFADVAGSNTSLVLEVGDDTADSIVLRHYSFAAGNTIDMLTATRASNTTANVSVAGNLSATGNITATNLPTKFTGSWTVPTGNSTQSFTVDGNHTYQMWVEGNIPNGIIAWNALVTVTNTNVPVLGQQFAWNYAGGGNVLMFNTIPAQIIGTAGAISNAEPALSNTNVFSFGINNASGNTITVDYGWVRIS